MRAVKKKKAYYLDPFRVSQIQITYRNKVKACDRVKIRYTDDAYRICRTVFDRSLLEYREQFVALYMNRAGAVLGCYPLSIGGGGGTALDVRMLLQAALKVNASALILAHNHPSGNLTPSSEDKTVTQRVRQACKLMGISCLDHLILTGDGYLSFVNEGLMNETI